jgi:hypothetical protein
MTVYYDVATILKSVGAMTETEASLPTGSDLLVRIQYINDALGEWADTYTWSDLKKTIYVNPTTASVTSIGLPGDFRQPLTPLVEYITNGVTIPYTLINPSDRFSKDTTDNYSYVTGTILNKSLQIPNGLISGTSLQIDYMCFPSSVATTTDYVPISSSQYLVKKVASMVFQSRSDSRYPLLQQEAQRLLSNAIEEQNVPFGRTNQIPMDKSFIMGVDG